MLGYGFSLQRIVSVVISVVLVMFSAVLHEIAHGWVALKCGDHTAKNAGRLTLNPAKHLDPFGSIALPIIMGIVGGPIFAFAKPVPYNPRNLRHPRRDEVLVALAGPACNLLQACVGALVIRLAFAPVLAITPTGAYLTTDSEVVYWLLQVVDSYVYVNLSLMLFNLIPLPPLDGSSIISPFLSGHAREVYYRIQAYSMPILLVALYLIPLITPWDPVGWYLTTCASAIETVLVGF